MGSQKSGNNLVIKQQQQILSFKKCLLKITSSILSNLFFFFFKPGLKGTSKVVSGVEPGVCPILFELFILFYVFIYFWTQTLQWKHGVLTTGIPTREFPKCQILREQLYMYTFMSYMGLPGGSKGKASACNAGGLGLIPM